MITNHCPSAGRLLHSQSNHSLTPRDLRGFSSEIEQLVISETDDELEEGGCHPRLYVPPGAYDKLEISKKDELEGFPCLFVPCGFDMNEDTGRIIYTNHCDWFQNKELEEEDWWEEDPGRYHFLNIA
ncbi:hypothetical protein ACH5RR_035540 [Cinchona calisaya]|uniref:Uncharacterized protein n=1 Tax=Cinchona calisaya TaxID=153742 RepID=A0ABD2Y235_9GENT